uniref:Nudix hydrolase n=1 Tax=Carcinus maenas virus 1 TaxID=2704945 RepID=A0A6G9HDJ9_9VIRU|nr:nudix hydrolase [Carcinus maenas virus 1]
MFNVYYPKDPTTPPQVNAHGGLVVIDKEHLYLLIEKKKVRDFGGKTERCDANVFQTACREFREESNIPAAEYTSFSYGNVLFYTIMRKNDSPHQYYTFYYCDLRLSDILNSTTLCKVMKLKYQDMWRVTLPANTSYKFCHRMNNGSGKSLNQKVFTALANTRLF